MMKKIKIIELLNKIANGEELPKEIKYNDIIYKKADISEDYYNFTTNVWFFKDVFDASGVNLEIEILDEEDKDIPLIPDDELYKIMGRTSTKALNYNFKVLQEKINQVVKEFNEYRKENEGNEKQKEKKQRNGI